jgi:aminoglycoside 3'-phosphotransferase-2
LPLSDLLGEAAGPPERVTVGLSGAVVERWGDRFLKAAPPTWDRGLDAEAARLEWLATSPLAGAVAEVVAFEPGPPLDRLLATAVAGADLTADVGLAPAERARRFGAHLRELHDGLDPAACPFDARLDVRLAQLERRVADGGVDADDFEPEQAGRTPADVLDELVRARPAEEDLVVTHGDWCFPNVLVAGDAWGMCDLAGLGVACRWYDLGIGARSTAHNVGAGLVGEFFAGYGLAAGDVDHDRLRYYVLVDELQ